MTDEEILDAILGVFQVNSRNDIFVSITFREFLHDGEPGPNGEGSHFPKGHVTVATIDIRGQKESLVGSTRRETLLKILEKLKDFKLRLEQHLSLVEVRSMVQDTSPEAQGTSPEPAFGGAWTRARLIGTIVKWGSNAELVTDRGNLVFSKSSVMQMMTLDDKQTCELEGVEVRRQGDAVHLYSSGGWVLSLPDSDLYDIMERFAKMGNP